jgi:ribosomal protein S18 acetylase RimI-like enzyme
VPTATASITIRRAKATDAARIAELSTQLGYPVTTREMAARLKLVLRERKAACFVAEEQSTGVIGWIHVSTQPLVEVAVRAEVNGLVVDEKIRSQGAGWALLQAAEGWARKHHCKSMSVRSNVLRDRAHAFYERHNYEHYKTQKAFRKTL